MEDMMKKITKTRRIRNLAVIKYEDPGHGWYKLDRKILNALNLQNEISTFSYERGNSVYLEEDCDGSKVLDALFMKGVEVRVITKTTNKSSKIRSYDRYKVRQ